MTTVKKDFRKLIQISMDEPDSFVVVIEYRDHKGRYTQRTISPYQWETPFKLQAMCLCKEKLRTFLVGRMRRVRLQPTSEVQAPVPILVGTLRNPPVRVAKDRTA